MPKTMASQVANRCESAFSMNIISYELDLIIANLIKGVFNVSISLTV